MAEKTNGELHLAARVARRGVDIEFTVRPGEVLAVLGPNGAGKSTAAAVVAGLLDADDALVRVGSRLLTDTRTGVHLPVHDRRVGLLAQDALLFPHMSALGNVAFAAQRRAGWRGARSVALHWLEQVGAADLAASRPGQLSGGQAQRVALARALAAEPEVLVLDEPLSRLDVDGAAVVRAALRSVLADRDCATVLITHDLPDVVALADRVLIMENGTAAETGAVTDVLAAPRSRFGARFAGLNVVHGVLRESTVLAAAGGQDWHGVATEPVSAGQHAVAIFAPAAVSVYRERPHGSPRNVVRGLICAIEANGMAARIRLAADPGTPSGLAADVTAGAVADLRLTVGEQVWFSVKTQAVTLFPDAREHRP